MADPLLSISFESASVPTPCLVFIPCHIEPDMRFSLIRLSDNLLLGVFKASLASAFDNLPRQVRRCISVSWLSSIARAGILVICLMVWLAFRHAPSLTSSLNLVEVETLPSGQVMLSYPSLSLRSTSTMVSSDSSSGIPQDFSLRLIPAVTLALYQRPGETSPVPSPAFTTSRSPIRRRVLCSCYPGSTPLPWPSVSISNSAPSCSPFGANITTLQDSLDVTGCCFAPLSQRVTRFSTSGYPDALDACYVAPWRLPRPDFHRLADR